ncbi:MAG: hypothetical protein Q4A92_08085, partial [Corynebacterium sp.]|nr:hypothetical protein [Corynebacterium sp.]
MFKSIRRRSLTAASTAAIAGTVLIPQAAAGDMESLKNIPGADLLSAVFDLVYPFYIIPVTFSANLGIF